LNIFNKDNKKHKQGKTRYDDYLELFRTDKCDTDYVKTEELYNEIKQYYENKVKSNRISISVEKIRLETNLGKYNGNIFNLSINYFIAMLAVILTLFFEKLDLFGYEFEFGNDINLNASFNNALKVISLVAIVLFLIKVLSDKKTILTNKRDILDNIKLKVLDDLEKEYSAENAKKKEIENQQSIIEQLKSQNNNSKKDVLMDMVAPAMLEVAATLLKKDSWIKRMFKKVR
jgi:hypothetical protein